jgi:TonB-dependent SusC/RagA subfamily outer membrane receptor
MKTRTLLFLCSFLFLMAACATSENTTSGSQDFDLHAGSAVNTVTDDRDYYRSLADYLQRVPGVYVSGPQNNQMVLIRGVSSFNSEIEPLYVIDGTSVGTNYNTVNNMLNVRDIDNVRVLKGSDAAIYGVRGANGVIVITTKR